MASVKRQLNETLEAFPVAPDVEPRPQRAIEWHVVQIQLPVNAPEDAGALVFNKDKTILYSVPVTRALRARFKAGELRAYFHVGISADDVEIGERAVGQSW
jgi:hypothetical protein